MCPSSQSNITTLANIPEGTAVNNVELRPGDGGKIARSGGNSAIVEGAVGDKIRVRLPSGSLKMLPSTCRATIGVLAGHGRSEMPCAPPVRPTTRPRRAVSCTLTSAVSR